MSFEKTSFGFFQPPGSSAFPKTKTPAKVKPYGATTPWVWVLEPTHGCNLSCGHCSCRLDKKGVYHYMSKRTWKNTWEIISKVSPTCRIDMALGGEPTLNPHLPKLIQMAREISPLSQIQVTTNGTMLRSGKVTYRQLLDAGANVVYTDMYGPREWFHKAAEKSGIPWYEYYDKPEGAPSPWLYQGPDLKVIVLQEQPENWPKSRYRAGLLGTWFNHLDWEAAKKFGLSPVTKPITRRCNQPFRYVSVDSKGNYLLCCQDNVGETSGQYGSVDTGEEGFKLFWYGKKMQKIRRYLHEKKRAKISQCSRCNVTFSRCDLKHWTEEDLSKYWNGKTWKEIV
jgi:sulfatase maturation enzyme AslB (radical SAM superfamily)